MPMLAVYSKKAAPLDLYGPLRKFIVSNYSEQEARDCEDDLVLLQSLRDEVVGQADTLESRVELLRKYYRCLTMVETRFPISTNKGAINTIHFTWYDAVKPSKKHSQQNIYFEKAAVVFNLGATLNQLAISCDRSNADGLKRAAMLFQTSAGYFSYLYTNLSSKAFAGSATGSFSTDVSLDCGKMLENLMLAQAQECFLESAVSGKKFKSDFIAKLAKGASDLFLEASKALNSPPLNLHFDKAWGVHAQLKSARYEVESLIRSASYLHEKEDIGDEIRRLLTARSVIEKSKKLGKVAGLGFEKSEEIIMANLKVAERENDKVYLYNVPDVLPDLPSAVAVQSKIPSELDASMAEEKPLFPGLVPETSMKLLSQYTERVDQLIRAQTERLQTESDLAKAKLSELGLPNCLSLVESPEGIPEDLQEGVEAALSEGGPEGLQAELAQLLDLRRVSEEHLVQCEDVLDKEQKDDTMMRANLGSRFSRPASSTLNKGLRDRVQGFRANLRQAKESDAKIQRALQDNQDLLNILLSKPVQWSTLLLWG